MLVACPLPRRTRNSSLGTRDAGNNELDTMNLIPAWPRAARPFAVFSRVPLVIRAGEPLRLLRGSRSKAGPLPPLVVSTPVAPFFALVTRGRQPASVAPPPRAAACLAGLLYSERSLLKSRRLRLFTSSLLRSLVRVQRAYSPYQLRLGNSRVEITAELTHQIVDQVLALLSKQTRVGRGVVCQRGRG